MKASLAPNTLFCSLILLAFALPFSGYAAEKPSHVTGDSPAMFREVPAGRLTFFDGSSPKTFPFPQSIAIGDFNGDGQPDMFVPVYSIGGSNPDGNVFLGDGNGNFLAGPRFPLAGQNVNNAAVADFNGDGIPDLAISLPDLNQVQVLLGNGDGSFTPLAPITLSGVFKVGIADFNGDGKADLFVTSFQVTVLLGNGDGTFVPQTPISITGGGYAAAAGDFNGDGITDLAVLNNTGSSFADSSVTVLIGRGNGTFRQMTQAPAVGIEPLAVATGDFNGDGILDLVVTNQNEGFPNPGTVNVLLGNGNGTFRPGPAVPNVGSIPYTVSVADFNGDGKLDLAIPAAGNNVIDVLLGNGHGGFDIYTRLPTGSDPVGAAVGNFSGNGIPDIAAADNTANEVTIWLTRRQP